MATSAADGYAGSMDIDECTAKTSWVSGKLAMSVANKADDGVSEHSIVEPRKSGTGEFHGTLVTYGRGAGDSSDVVSDLSCKVDKILGPSMLMYSWCAVSAGCLNAGKLLSSN